MSTPALNRELVLESPERLRDGAGGFVLTWRVLGRVWGAVRPRTGRLTSNGEAGAVSVSGFQVVVRAHPVGHSARPLAGQRFRMGARVFAIIAVTEDEPKARFLLCECREEVVS